MFKQVFLSLISFCLLVGTTHVSAQDRMVDEIVAVVGGNIILKSDIENEYINLQAQGQSMDGDMKCSILENLLQQKLLIAEAELDSTIIVTDSQVLQSMEQQIDSYMEYFGTEAAVERYFHSSMAEIRSQLEDVIRNSNITSQMQSKIVSNIVATPAEVRRYYRQLTEDEIPMVNTQVQYAEIIVEPKIDMDQINEIKARLRDYKRRIENGESFSTLALLYSEDGSASDGGEIGFYARANLDAAYATAAFNLKGDRISNVVESIYGYHIIQLIEKRDNKVNTRHILLTAKPSPEALDEAKSRLDSISDIIRKETLTFERAAYMFSDNEDTRNGGGLAINPNTMSSKWYLEELDGDISKVLDELKINEISEPFLSIDRKTNKTVYKIVKLIDRIDDHKANLQEDYQVISNMYLNEKQNEILHDWIADKLNVTYVHINDAYLNCNFEFDGWIK